MKVLQLDHAKIKRSMKSEDFTNSSATTKTFRNREKYQLVQAVAKCLQVSMPDKTPFKSPTSGYAEGPGPGSRRGECRMSAHMDRSRSCLRAQQG